MADRTEAILRLVCKALLLAATLVVLLWFLRQTAEVLLLSLFAMVLAIMLNAPVSWRERRRVNEVMGDFVTPRIRAKAMDLHPVSVLFVMAAMAAAFGIPGALIATPVTAFIKAYFVEFYPPARHPTPEGSELVEQMVWREVPPQPEGTK